MISVTGRVIDEGGLPLKKVKVIALADWFLTKEKATEPVSVDGDGQFVLQLESIDPAEAAAIAPVAPSFRVRVIDVVGRQLSEDKVLDATVLNHDLNKITVHRSEAEGLLVTNKLGVPDFVSEGNAIKLLIDGEEAFGRVADEIKRAENAINMTQLFFQIPAKFDQDNETIDPATKEPREKPNLVFKFDPDTLPIEPVDPLPENLKKPRIGDERPERLLFDKVNGSSAFARILLNDPGLGFPEGVFWSSVLTGAAGGIGAGGIIGIGALLGVGISFFPLVLFTSFVVFFFGYIKARKVLEETSFVEELKIYFGAAFKDKPEQRVIVRGFSQRVPDQGVQHCKMVIVDHSRAVVIGSPFEQRYFDTLFHLIEEPRRGENTSDIVHDLSMAVVGPAARDLFESFRLYWNEDDKQQQIDPLPKELEPNTQTSAGDEDDLAKLQVVRTLSAKRFKGLKGKSEKGILEGYLRAFAEAQHYIYLETQYFTDGVITDALVAKLKANKKLQLIIVVPIKPDVLFYPRRQEKRIEQLREAGGNQVGVFTRWTYDARPNEPRPWVAPVYIHAKGAIVDDSWATIGSANLDGLSLDYNLLLSPLVFGETTACELNLNILPASPGSVTKFAELMRRRLWSEHLGIVEGGKLKPDHDSLKKPADHDWLKLWREKAKLALEHVKNAARTELPGFVLEYPKEKGGCLDTPRRHLGGLGVEIELDKARIRPVTGNRKFHFSTGKWDQTPLREDFKR